MTQEVGCGGLTDAQLAARVDPLAPYAFHNYEPATISYIGNAVTSARYLIRRYDETAPPFLMRYANVSNNPTHTTFAAAWTNRATLTYDFLHNLTGV